MCNTVVKIDHRSYISMLNIKQLMTVNAFWRVCVINKIRMG